MIRKKYGSEWALPVSRENFKLFHAIIGGESFESYGDKIGVTRQAVSKRFWLTFVNLFPMLAETYKYKNLNQLRVEFNEIRG